MAIIEYFEKNGTLQVIKKPILKDQVILTHQREKNKSGEKK